MWVRVRDGRYEVSDQGEVRNSKTQKVRVASLSQDGYYRISVYVPESQKYDNWFIHRLVCEAFHGPAPEDKPWALHRNGDRQDNRAENLYWGSPADNTDDSFKHGTARMSNWTACLRGHQYTEGSYYLDRGKKSCKECRKLRRQIGIPDDDPRHGKKSTYDNYGCRCERCADDKRRWTREYRNRVDH